ncbi:hypothetical protein JKF63_05431 [Porcisia hertigi]|uniref:Uncharacterized protein n=1 Tax=Porcisia hertigi TaxID=2761500 RepID=A0A836LDH0_9TRYP|nr:hypothetical protein JKF63_05431 [Porcisia hertigi]
MSVKYSHVSGNVDAPPSPRSIYLSEPLPSSLKKLGLSLADYAVTPTVSTPVEASPASPSFRVRAMHLDDVAKDVILVCEDSITLIVPLAHDVSAPAPFGSEKRSQSEENDMSTAHDNTVHPPQASASTSPSTRDLGSPPAPGVTLGPPSCHPPSAAAAAAAAAAPQSFPSTTSTAATAVRLRMTNPLQAWTSSLSSPGCTTASTSGLRLPRRLPMSHKELRCSPAVLVAVPLTSLAALSSSAPSTVREGAPRPASGSLPASGDYGCAVPPPVMAICIMECPVLPEGVDYIEATTIPFARPLAKIVCAPNTLRFREAWYPIQFFCWCDHDVAAAASPSTMQARLSYTDRHLLCVSSIAVDLIRVRCRMGPALSPQLSPPQPASAKPPSLLSNTPGSLREEGYTVQCAPRTPFDSPASALRATSLTHLSLTASLATSTGERHGTVIVSVSVLQRYVTHSDWCTYDARSHVLLSLNRARPSVVKPVEVHARRRVSAVDQKRAAEFGMSGEAAPLPLELRTWAELTLTEGLSTTRHLNCGEKLGTHGRVAAAAVSEPPSLRLHPPNTSQVFFSVLGVLTVYGQTFVYHLPSCCGSVAGQHTPVMDLYMHCPSKGYGDRPSSGVSPAERTLSRGVSCAGAPASALEGSSRRSLLRRLTAAAAQATASAPLPRMCDGTFIHVARLSLAAVTSPASRVSQAAVQETSLDPVRADGLAVPLPHSPSLVPLCIQVIDNLIVVHAPDTAQSAVYDLADRDSSNVFQASAATDLCRARENTAVRDYLSGAVASDVIRAQVQSFDPAVASAALNTPPLMRSFSEPILPSRACRCATSASREVAESRFGGFQGSHLHYNGGGGATRSTADASTAAPRSSLSLSEAVSHLPAAVPETLQVTATDTVASGLQQRYRSSGGRVTLQRQAPSADFTSMMFVLTSSVLAVVDRNRTKASAVCTAVSAARWVYPLHICRAAAMIEACEIAATGDKEGSASGGSEPIVYSDYQWLLSPRLPLVMDTRDGALRVCRLDPIKVAEWRLHDTGVSIDSDHADEDPWLRQPKQSLNVKILDPDTAARHVRSYVGFLCRRREAFFNDPSRGSKTGIVHALIEVLRELTFQVVNLRRDEGGVNAAGVLRAGLAACTELDGLRHLLYTAAASPPCIASRQLYALWMSMVGSLTVETAFLAQCTAVERRRALALEEMEEEEEEEGAGSTDGACASSSEASGRLLMSSAEMQRLILENVFRSTWAALASPSSSHYLQHPQEWQRRRSLLEGLMCDYVQLLHAATIPVAPQLQCLLLEVSMGVAGGAPANGLGSPESTLLCRAARRVRELLRLRALEPNTTTARWLLRWWRTYQDAKASTRHVERAVSSLCCLTAKGSPAGYCTPLPPGGGGGVDSAFASPVAAAPTLHQGTDISPCLRGPGDSAEEVDTLFEEAIRILEVEGFLLEVAEAHSWRSDFTAAAAALQCAREKNAFAEVPGVTPESAPSPCRRTRVRSWDTIALSVLDGAWRSLCLAEEELFSHTGGLSLRSPPTPQHSSSEVASTPPKSGRLRSLERQARIAQRVYITVAGALLVRPTAGLCLPPSGSGAAEAPSRDFLTETVLGNADGRFHTHEVHYEQLRCHMEQGWHELHLRGET